MRFSRPADGVASSACRIHLVRHGTTRMNLENRYRGRREVPLGNGIVPPNREVGEEDQRSQGQQEYEER